ncbi:serine hydrolase [Phenylobacterium sp.]|uniref:serine hydrolase n=1 Tax=Phenylobacterium sp. TaxID=1871053 RepID=UPI003BA8B51D
MSVLAILGVIAALADGPLPMPAFTPPAEAAAPAARLEGRLTLTFGPRPNGLTRLRDDDPPSGPDPRLAWPALTLDLVQDGDRLIPAPVNGEAAGYWDWSAGPGRVWAGAEGDVAVLPVALRERNANCAHNGLLRLTLSSAGAPRTAQVRLGAETCLYEKFDAWAAPRTMGFTPGGAPDREGLIARDRENRAAQLPVRPLSGLADRYPGVDLPALARAAGDNQAVYGVVADGVNYAAPCQTRFGEDSFCEGRTLPSYSTAKTLVGGLGLMRLERLAPGLATRALTDLVPACGVSGAWSGVALLDLLDMASGHYDSAAFEADENAAGAFFITRTHAEKLAYACRYPRRATPGATWVYRTSDSYLLGTALQAATPGDLYDTVLRPIWRDLKLSPALDETRRTLDARGQPFVGWGLFLRRDDVARLGVFLSPANVAEQDRLFSPRLIGEALQRPGLEGGLAAGSARLRYSHGVWARDIADLVGCAHPVWTPFLSGYGGISIVLFPNGVVFYAIGDESHFDWGPAAGSANAVKALCHD